MDRRLGRFKDLQAKGIVQNWTTLSRWITDFGFPPPFRPTARTSLFDLEAIDRWLETRRRKAADKTNVVDEQPVEQQPPVKRPRGRPKGSKNRPKVSS